MPRRGTSRRRGRRPVADDQIGLLPGDPEHGWWRCQGIFSPSYLTQHPIPGDYVPPEDQVGELYEFVKDLWLQKLPMLRRRREPFTRSDFLDPVLSRLGWEFIPEESLPDTQTRKTPDYCLFGDAETKARVAALSGEDIFRAAHTALEAKKVQHPLDRVSADDTPGLFPSDQVQDYLQRARDSSGRRFFNWAILTNGNEWRLYCANAEHSSYFAFHLAVGANFCTLEDFRLFVALFSPGAFERDAEGRCPLDELREESLRLQVKLEENLRNRAFDVLEELSEGFFSHPDNELTESDLPAVYETSLIFLYRLLFVLYAESRGLLPVKPTGAGARQRYRDRYSLARLIPALQDEAAYADPLLPELYGDLLALFHLINGTDATLNRRIDVTRYNGGLFDPDQYPLIEEWRVADGTLARVLRQIMFAQRPARGRARQLRISTNETIDYSTLEVRQLGDIYEGLLGGRLQLASDGHLDLVNERGQNQRHGTFYTPDWIVLFLRNNSLQPLLDEAEQAEAVQTALREGDRDNSFAEAVIQIKVLDPAMGSGHFLVRATEWLAEKIVRHPTTERATEQIVPNGERQRRRDDISADGRLPVSPGLSQEQAEIAYWRRRVVESCIYGVDTNNLAVELAKLALWLTCIAINEPLNFLDHHLRCGNSLLFAHPDEIAQLPASDSEQAAQLRTTVVGDLRDVLQTVVGEMLQLSAEASTRLEVVKGKLRRWQRAHKQLDPFLRVSDLWLAARDGVEIDPDDYRLLVLHHVERRALSAAGKRRASRLARQLASALEERKKAHSAFHWHLEFPEVFFASDGAPLPRERSGFDCVLGNPPYISVQTSRFLAWRQALEARAGYVDDLYVHFTDLGFRLLRPGGTFGFIVSDTFFTLASKLRMREQLQSNRLRALGQCDPFRATVDAAIFVAQKRPMADDEKLLFVQARHKDDSSKPGDDLPTVSLAEPFTATAITAECRVEHGEKGCLRLHRVPISLYRNALKQAFFEPRPGVLSLHRKFNDPAKALVAQWWDVIESSDRFSAHEGLIRQHDASLTPGDIALTGLLAEGGVGLQTGNNPHFLGYLEGSPKANAIRGKREEWTRRWQRNGRINAVFTRLLGANGGDASRPTANVAAWETCVEPLREQFSQRDLGFSRTDLYRVVPLSLVAGESDFAYTWRDRKAELLALWRRQTDLTEFWKTADLLGPGHDAIAAFAAAEREVSDEEFCVLFAQLMAWRDDENSRRRRSRGRTIALGDLGLRNGERYTEPADCQRIAVIYNGLRGRGQWLPFRKGDPEGHKWIADDPLFIDWSEPSVAWLYANSGRRASGMPVVRNAHLYLQPNVTWSRTANHTDAKARLQPPCVFDTDSAVLTPLADFLSVRAFLSILNSEVFSFFCKRFLNNTNKYEATDLRMMPLVIPTPAQAERLSDLADQAIEAKRLAFAHEQPSHQLAAFCRELAAQLAAAPPYLRPGPQAQLLDTPDACLKIIELGVNWEAEKLYGVEGLGPFDEF